MNPTVKVFTAGDHFAGLGQAGDSEELIQRLLVHSGYTKAYEWECRVDKLKHCSGESRPVRVVGFKTYGVILRVKPHVHATIDYQMTLYIPQGSGYSAKNLFEQLRANEKSISRVIRQQERQEKQPKEEVVNTVAPIEATPEPKPAPIPPAPLPFPTKPQEVVVAKDERPEFKNLQAVVKHEDKLKYVLMKIKVVNDLKFCRNKVQFVEVLKHECKWSTEGHGKAAVGRLLTELCKADYLMETVNERDKVVGYTLTDKGCYFINYKGEKPLKTTPEKPPEAPSPRIVQKKEEVMVDIPSLLINMKDKLRELADAANKIAANNAEKVRLETEYRQKIAALDQENEELSKVMGQNKECQDVLSKLGQFITPLPLQGMRHSD